MIVIKGVIEDVLDPISFWLIWNCLGSNAPCFFCTLFDMSFKVTCATTSFGTICFFTILKFCYIFYLSSCILSIYYNEVISYCKCASTNPRSFAYGIGLGKVRGNDTREVGVSSSSKGLNSLHASIPKLRFSTSK